MPADFDVYVIHSPALGERRAALEPALAALGWQARWITAPDSREFTMATRVRYRVHPRVTNSECSVYLKQLEALKQIALGPRDRALILEDDALLPADPQLVDRYLLDLPAGFHAVFFGASCDQHAQPMPSSPLFGQGLRTRSMSGVLITKACAQRLSALLDDQPIAQPIDIVIDDCIRREPLNCFWSVPPIIGNGSESGRYARAITNAAWREYPWVRRLRRWRDQIPRLPGRGSSAT